MRNASSLSALLADRERHYRAVLQLWQLPPDPAMLHPKPPTAWDAARTYVLVDQEGESDSVSVVLWGSDDEVQMRLDEFEQAHTEIPSLVHQRALPWRSYPRGGVPTGYAAKNALQDGLRELPERANVSLTFLLKRS